MSMLRRSAAIALLALLGAGAAAAAPGVVLAGRMGQRALLVVDGRAYAVAVGEVAAGVRLLRWQDDAAEIEVAGGTQSLRLGAAPAQMASTSTVPARGSESGREIVIPVGQGGHFTANGSIQGHEVRFMVDTGATLVSLGKSDADRLGIDLRNATQTFIQTANGRVLVHLVTLPQLRVGDVEIANVGAAVLPMPMPFVLLGNSFLDRFQMRRENDLMVLAAR